MSDFIIPDRADLEWVLDAFGITQDNPDYEAALVMLAAVPCGGEIWKIRTATQIPEDRIQYWKEAMVREAVWPGLLSWATSGDDAQFACDLLAVTGKLRRIVYGSGEIKYIDSRQPQRDKG